MNKHPYDKIGHAAIAVCLVAMLPEWSGILATLALFYGREEAQQERRYIYDPSRGGNSTEKWKAVLPWTWQKDAVLDFTIPVAVSIAAYYLIGVLV